MQALLITAAGTDFLTKGCLSWRNLQNQEALDLAFHGRQWHAVQLLVTAGKALLWRLCCCLAALTLFSQGDTMTLPRTDRVSFLEPAPAWMLSAMSNLTSCCKASFCLCLPTVPNSVSWPYFCTARRHPVHYQHAGALYEGPALESARVQLQEAMPMQSSSAQSGLSSLVVGFHPHSPWAVSL